LERKTVFIAMPMSREWLGVPWPHIYGILDWQATVGNKICQWSI